MSLAKTGLSRFQHLSDETISRLIAGELSAFSSFRARKHLDRCWQCRCRREAFEHAAMQVTECRNYLVERIPANPQRRAALLADFSKRAQQANMQPMFTRSLLDIQVRSGNPMNHVVASAAIVVTAALLLVWVWRRPPVSVSAAQLIDRAEIADQAVTRGKSGVVFQRTRIATSHFTIERDIYRDVRGIRRLRPQPLQAEAVPVREMLAKAGVDWEAPLSAGSFRDWHDRQPAAMDTVSKRDGNLLTLVTRVPNSSIREESFTVRASDFHPVQRTIQTDSFGTIEIAELDYAVLDWSGVNEALFEPLTKLRHAAPLLPPVLPPGRPSATALDAAELQVRLALNRLHADEGEQIEIGRTDDAVEVKGVVETDSRRQEIVSGLRSIPHVKPDLLSIDEVEQGPPENTTAEPVIVQSVDVQASALERYLTAQSHQPVSPEAISRRLLDGALKVSQNATELSNIKNRFSTLDASQAKNDAFLELSQSYSERLLAGLDDELAALESLGFSQPPPGNAVPPVDLAAEVERNETLCRELLSGNSHPQRSVEEIVPDLYLSIERIHSAVALSRQ